MRVKETYLYIVLNWVRSLRLSNKKTQANRTAAKKSVGEKDASQHPWDNFEYGFILGKEKKIQLWKNRKKKKIKTKTTLKKILKKEKEKSEKKKVTHH